MLIISIRTILNYKWLINDIAWRNEKQKAPKERQCTFLNALFELFKKQRKKK